MTVGEKIQYYRKKCGFSQEELGKQLFVSRQTVSLWEMDKTLPTIDNLLRLKDIFGITIDEIISSEVTSSETCDVPSEKYVFNYTAAELKEIFSKAILSHAFKTVKFFIVCVLTFLCISGSSGDQLLLSITFGVCLKGMVDHVRTYLRAKKTYRKEIERTGASTYFYDVYEDHFVLDVVKNNETQKRYKVYFSDIEGVIADDNYLMFKSDGESYVIKKSVLKENSALYLLQTKIAKRNELKPLNSTLITFSVLLIVLSFASFFGGLASSVTLSGGGVDMPKYMWAFFLFLPVPLSSVAYGLYLKKKHFKYKRNVVVGLVVAVLLCIYGSFSFVF